MAKFSIITICYNPGRNLSTAVNSVLTQSQKDIEYIVVDGGSNDGSVQYIQSLNSFVSKFISEPDRGIYDALNKGIRVATGDVIGFMHADDMYADEKVVSNIADVFNKTGADSVYGDLAYVSKENTSNVIRMWKSGPFSRRDLALGWMPPHPTLFLKREVYEKYRLPSGEYFDSNMKIAADYDFMMRILGPDTLKIEYLPRVLTKMRVGGSSNKSLQNIIQKSREDLIAIRRNNIGGIGTLIAKNLRKLPQFFMK